MPTSLPTNYAPGDYVLFPGFIPGGFPSPGNPGPISLRFETPVFAAGTQITVGDVTDPYTIFLDAYDAAGGLLGHFETTGRSTLDMDNSATFLGAKSDVANIARLVYSTSVSGLAMGMNQVSLDVPEPALLFPLGLTVFFAGRRKCDAQKGR